MTTIPTWAALCAAVGTPLLAFLGIIVAQRITRRGVTELEMRSRREETPRVLRWAAELSVSDDSDRSRLGPLQLLALGSSDLLDAAQQLFVDAALRALVDRRVDEAERAASEQDTVRSGSDEGSRGDG